MGCAMPNGHVTRAELAHSIDHVMAKVALSHANTKRTGDDPQGLILSELGVPQGDLRRAPSRLAVASQSVDFPVAGRLKGKERHLASATFAGASCLIEFSETTHDIYESVPPSTHGRRHRRPGIWNRVCPVGQAGCPSHSAQCSGFR